MTRRGAPLLLHRGDPLPELPIDGFDRERLGEGVWLLLVVAGAELEAGELERIRHLVLTCGKAARAAVFTVGGVGNGAELFADPGGVAARRLGALVGEAEFCPLAVLVDPRGRVRASAAGESCALASERVLGALGR